MPLTTIDEPVNLLDNQTYWQRRIVNDTATVGYFSTKLESDIRLSIGGARHSGIVQYDYPTGERHVLVDVSHFLPNVGGSNEDQFYDGGSITISDGGKRYAGYGSYGGGFSDSAPMTTYFCADFDQAPAQAHTFRGRNTFPARRQHVLSDEVCCTSHHRRRAMLICHQPIPHPTYRNRSTEDSGPLTDRVGAIFTWDDSANSTSVKSKIGISLMSVDKACSYKDTEIPSWNLNDTVAAAVEEWNADVFSKIQVSTDSSQNRTNLILLYSSLYFMHLMPSDRSGENPLWESGDSWDDFYTLWDIFRCTVSMYHLIQPKYYQSMIRSIIDIWKYEGFMPDGRSGNYNGLVQGGSNADNVLADAYIKGLPNINWTEGYQAMVKDAEVVPFNTFNQIDPTNGIQQGRGALRDWLDLGYISVDRNTRSISRSIEYALNDFSLAQVSKGVAPEDYDKYLNRSANWQNIWSDASKI